MNDPELIRSLSRKTSYFFAFYIVYTFAIHHLPDEGRHILVFLFVAFWNIGVGWAAYRLVQLAGRPWLEKLLFALQLGFFGWIIYAYRFAYMPALEYTKQTFFTVPLMQYGILFVLLLVVLILNKDRSA